MHGTKYQQCSFFVLDFGVLKLLITLNSSDWLRVHSMPSLFRECIKENEKTNLARCKAHVGDLLDGMVIIPFTECSWNDTCLSNCRFCTKWAHSTNVCDPLKNGLSINKMSLKYSIVWNSKIQKQMMNILDALTHALKSKVMRTTKAFNMKSIQCGPKLY